MSNLTATAISPLLHALSAQELEALIGKAKSLLPDNHKPVIKAKEDIYRNMPDHFRPENHEAFVQGIISGTL